jgi:hypothetical protein
MRNVFFVILLSISAISVRAEKGPGEAPTNLVQSELGNSRLARMGFVDVTAAPFFADPSGKKDATNALQKAIVFARDHQMVCLLPSGRYRVSDTLSCIQYRPMRRDGKRKGTRDYPCVLLGSRRSPNRPRIVLAPRSPGFTNPEKPKYVVHFWSPGMGTETPIDEPQPNISMNQMFIGIDIEIGKGNPGAVAIRHRAAQGSGVQDCTIYANDGYCGLEGGAGSGGSHANVTVIGGRIGADLRQTQPAPTITGFTLINQTETALICSSRQALCAVGLIIESQTAGPVIVTKKLWGAHHGQLCLIDSSIDMKAPGNNTAIEAESSLYLNNVFIRGAKTLIKQPDKPVVSRASSPRFEGGTPSTRDWVHIAEYAGGVAQSYRARKYGNRTFVFPAPIFIDGKKLDVPWLADMESNQEPPADLQSRHLWTDEFPSWESPGAVSVKDEPFGAVGDGVADDTKAIQKAIDEHEIVFLPKGNYRVSRTIQLRPNTKLIGLHRCYSWLVPLDRVGGDFHDPDNPRPVVQTADDREANTVVAFFGIRTLRDSQTAYCLNWQSGHNSIFRDTNIVFSFKAPAKGPARSLEPGIASRLYNHPVVLIDGHGGGRWYNFHQESSRGHNINYRHLLINGTDEPLSMYQCNPEHARSDANLEIRGARNVTIYGIKGEYNQPIVWIRDSDNVRIFGYGGNAAAHKDHALFVVERTPNFLLANLVDSPRMPQGIPDTFFAGNGVDPRYWYMLREITTTGESVLTPPLDRPVLYKRGDVKEVHNEIKTRAGGNATPIKPYSKNPSYWEYHGRPLLLIGCSDRDNIFQ